MSYINHFHIEHVIRTLDNLANYKGEYEFTMLINSLSGLLILPVEYIKERKAGEITPLSDISNIRLNRFRLSFLDSINDEYYFNLKNPELTFRKFLFLIRNSFSHMNIQEINNHQSFTGIKIWNKNGNNEKTFEMIFTYKELKDFIIYISELFLEDLTYDRKRYSSLEKSLEKIKSTS
jgi:hypothetical protein